jgi:hypothetical protein
MILGCTTEFASGRFETLALCYVIPNLDNLAINV